MFLHEIIFMQDIEGRHIAVDGGEIMVRCLIPTPSGEGSHDPYPLLVWYHGGGE